MVKRPLPHPTSIKVAPWRDGRPSKVRIDSIACISRCSSSLRSEKDSQFDPKSKAVCFRLPMLVTVHPVSKHEKTPNALSMVHLSLFVFPEQISDGVGSEPRKKFGTLH